MIRVVVVDDQKLVRQCVRVKLEADPDIEVTGEAGSGEEARRLVPEVNADLVVMDLNMPGMGGIEATARLVKALPRLRVLGLSYYTDGPFPARFLKAGGVGYLTKNASAAELLDAVKAVYRGRRYLSPEVATALAVGIGTADPRNWGGLGDREMQVWKLIADGVDPDEIATSLHLSLKTVQAHRRHLLEKLRLRNDVQLARLARECGIVT